MSHPGIVFPLPVASHAPLPSGDLAQEVLRRGFYVSSPTSGNAFSREMLQHLMPILDEAEFLQLIASSAEK